jgi:hypothetical protein
MPIIKDIPMIQTNYNQDNPLILKILIQTTLTPNPTSPSKITHHPSPITHHPSLITHHHLNHPIPYPQFVRIRIPIIKNIPMIQTHHNRVNPLILKILIQTIFQNKYLFHISHTSKAIIIIPALQRCKCILPSF